MIQRMLASALACLVLCAPSAVCAQAVSRVSAPLKAVGTYAFKADPNFSPDNLPADMQVWYERFWNGIDHLAAYNSYLTPDDMAESGNLYNIGRHFNTYITTLTTTLRVTKDPKIVEEIDRLMEIVRSKLADTDADGFLNYTYKKSDANLDFFGTDEIELDEILAHSQIAAAAAVLKANAELDPKYGDHANAWTDYLVNDFEAKWRERNDVPFGFPFLEKTLMHPSVQFMRYHYYMAELTGDEAYKAEAQRIAGQVSQQVRDVYTPTGPAYVWDQRFLPAAPNEALACQPFVYLQLTFQAFEDMTLEGFSIFDDAFMQRVANANSNFVIPNGYNDMKGDICGGQYLAGLTPSFDDSATTYHFLNQPNGELGKWDATGKLTALVEKAYDTEDLDNPNNVRAQTNLAAEMLFILADHPDQR